MQFDTPILVRPFSSSGGLTPIMADRTFWSDVLASRKYAVDPDIVYSLVTATGDRFVDDGGNQFIALT